MKEKDKIFNLGVLVSGSGSNLQSIIDASSNNIIPDAQVKVVVSNRKKAYGLERARNNNIDNIYLNSKHFTSKENFDNMLVRIFNKYQIDLVILAGYLSIVSQPLLEAYSNRILNIHPSLLPDFGGVNMYGMNVHKAVVAKGVKYSGCTVHVVTSDIDQGPIVDQETVEVKDTDTPEILASRILPYEHKLYPKAINIYLNQLVKEQHL